MRDRLYNDVARLGKPYVNVLETLLEAEKAIHVGGFRAGESKSREALADLKRLAVSDCQAYHSLVQRIHNAQSLSYAELEKERQVQQQPAPRPVYVAVATCGIVRIQVNCDAGYGNSLELRGNVDKVMSWEKGRALTCNDSTHWETQWDMNMCEFKPFEYKVVKITSDGQTLWETIGANRVFKGSAEDTKEIYPQF